MLPPQLTPNLFSLLMGFAIALLCLPIVLGICRRWQLFDTPGLRKLHRLPKPTLGGLAFISATLLTLVWEKKMDQFPASLIAALAIITLLGLLDDLRNLRALPKLVLQIGLAALVAAAGPRLQQLHGFLGADSLHPLWQYLLTIGWLVVVTNAFNLVDGVDGLAGGIGLISLVVLGFLLAINGDAAYSCFAFALAGSVLGFLAFNVQPSRIFMGDTGALFIGFSIGILGLRLMQVHPVGVQPLPHPMLVVAGTVAMPVMDALRLFCRRLLQGHSPFRADNQHLHHLLTARGHSHRTTSILLMGMHYLLTSIAILLQHSPFALVLLLLLSLPVLLSLTLQKWPFHLNSRMRQTAARE